MKPLRGVLVLLAAVAPVLAAAQPAGGPQAVAQRLIAAGDGDAAAYFSNVTPPGGPPTVRHRRSGLTCVFTSLQQATISVFPRSPSAVQGDDVGCNMTVGPGGYIETIYATRYSPPLSAEQVLAGADQAMQRRYRDMVARPGDDRPPAQLSARDAADLPPVVSRRYLATDSNGHRIFTRASVATVGDWTVMLRFSADASDADAADRWANEAFARVVLSVVHRREAA